jgi:hypothetical protein
MTTQYWPALVPDGLMLSSEKIVNQLEFIRNLWKLSHEDFAKAIVRTPSAIKRLIIAQDILLFTKGLTVKHERYASIILFLEEHLHKIGQTEEEFLIQIADATEKANGISSKYELVDFVLHYEKKRGTFYNPNGILIEIDAAVASVAQEALKGVLGVGASSEKLGYFDYDVVPSEYEPLYAKSVVPKKPTIPPISIPPEIESIFQIPITTQAPAIAKIVCYHYRNSHGTVKYRANAFIDQELLNLLRSTFRKPLFKTWQGWLPDYSLKTESVFEMLSSRILLTANVSGEYSNQFWDGKGHYQQSIKLTNIASFSGAASAFAFSISLHKEIFEQVKNLLEPMANR